MSKANNNKKPVRVQIPTTYLHPDTLRVIDEIGREMAVTRGVAIDEVVRRYIRLLSQVSDPLIPALR